MRNPKDFTTRRKGGSIIVCPTCGRKGYLRQFRDGTRLVMHRIEYLPPFGAATVVDHCAIQGAHTGAAGRS